jgi:hypothetical protein
MGTTTLIPITSQRAPSYFIFESISVEPEKGDNRSFGAFKTGLTFTVQFSVARQVRDLTIGMGVHTLDEFAILTTHSDDLSGATYAVGAGTYVVTISFSPNYLRPGRYLLSLGALAEGNLIAHVPAAAHFEVPSGVSDGRIGVLKIPMQWSELQRM